MTLESPIVKESKNFRSYKILSYDFFDGGAQTIPEIFTSTGKGDRMRANTNLMAELGFLKYSFFKSLSLFKPAVTILVFDWQN